MKTISYPIKNILIATMFATQGTAMYAEIPQQHIVTHGILLETEKTYTLSRFQVKNARLTYMPFEANLMIEIGAYTLIQVVANPAPTFPKYIYKLTQFSELKPLQGSTKTYIGNQDKSFCIFTNY